MEVKDALSGILTPEAGARLPARQQRRDLGIAQGPRQLTGQQGHPQAAIGQAQVPALLIGMPLARMEDQYISGRDGTLAMDRPMDAMTRKNHGNLDEIVVMQGRIPEVKRLIHEDGDPGSGDAITGPEMEEVFHVIHVARTLRQAHTERKKMLG